ncbi:MAG: hypothetical protein JST93_05330 [Acidobacteria bacterium]|nr:hypothetical protein [Acidobacteriota bacterium]
MAAFIIRAWSRRRWNDSEAFQTYAPPSQTPWFTDVDTGHQFFPYIQKMWELGITSGCIATPRKYCPDLTIENYQIAVFIARARKVTDNNCLAPCSNDDFEFPESPYFSDVPSTHGYFRWIQRIAVLGVVSPFVATPGCSVGYFCPSGVFTRRGEMAKEVMDGIVTWSYWNARILVEMHLNPPTQWKGINYSPRLHTYFRMLYDWYTNDSVTNQPVHQMVDADLTMLKQSGFNLLHLYLWDTTLLKELRPDESAGFCPYPDSPSSCGSQWTALADFVQKAETKGLYVTLTFASGRFKNDFNAGVNSATQFASWANEFMYHLRERKNILMWGFPWSVVPPPDMSAKAIAWRDAYRLMDQNSRAVSPNPRIMGLIGTYLEMVLVFGNPMISRGSQYVWQWQTAQTTAKGMRNLLTSAFGYTKDPDIYLMHVYHPNSFDLSASLNSLLSPPQNPATALNPDRDKIFVSEFATGSPVKEPGVPAQEAVKGNDVQIYGDENTPVLTPSGQGQWLTCALAAFANAGIQKLAYWALYDPYTMWSGFPWFQTGQDLAWNGYWGLKYEREADGNKPAWTALTNFYQGGSTSCTSTPITTFKTDNTHYTTGQPARLVWTAANTAIWQISSSLPASYDCRDQSSGMSGPQFASVPAGSCAFAFSDPPSTPGTQTHTFTARAAGGAPSTTATAQSTTLSAPLVFAVTDSDGSPLISRFDTIKITGNAFARWGGNSLRFVRSGFTDVWIYAFDGSGLPFNEKSYTQISAELGGRLAAGPWQLYVYNGYPSSPAGPISVTID